jgi:hypothetical protein
LCSQILIGDFFIKRDFTRYVVSIDDLETGAIDLDLVSMNDIWV